MLKLRISTDKDLAQLKTISGNMKKVLIVDDEPDILRLNRYILEAKNYTVIEAGNGKEALALFQHNADEVDLVILDLTMPVMDGLDTFTHINKIKPGVQFLLVTGFDDMWDLDEMIHHENVKILKKPYQIDDLLEVINTLFGEPS